MGNFGSSARIYELIWQIQSFRMQHKTCAPGGLNIAASGNKSWHGWETWQKSINFFGQREQYKGEERMKRDVRRWNLPWLRTRNSVCAVRQTWGEKLLIFWDPKMDENNFKSQTVLVFCWAVAVVWFVQSVWPDPAPHDLFGGCICFICLHLFDLVDLILLLKCHDSVNTNTATLTRISNTSAPGQEEACSIIVDYFGEYSLNVPPELILRVSIGLSWWTCG